MQNRERTKAKFSGTGQIQLEVVFKRRNYGYSIIHSNFYVKKKVKSTTM